MTDAMNMELNAYIDGELGPEEAAELEAMLAEDEDQRAAFADLTRNKRQVHDALHGLALGPSNIRTAALERKLARTLERKLDTSPRKGFGSDWMPAATRTAAAAAFVAAGWYGHDTLAPSLGGVPEYVSEAMGAHLVFAEDNIQPAEFTQDNMESATEWFTRKLGVKIAVPALQERGLELVGARLLGTKEGPLAQFIYEDDTGRRLSLTVAKHAENMPVQTLKTLSSPAQMVGYWSNADLDYALVSQDGSIDVNALVREIEKDI